MSKMSNATRCHRHCKNMIYYARFFKRHKKMKVCKFGGSSFVDAGQLAKVIDIVLSDLRRR